MLTRGLLTALTLAAVAASGVTAVPALAARTAFPVSGRQTVVDADKGTYRMRGGLLGAWQQTSFTEVATTPLYEAKGTESFQGCVDRGRDGSCAGDPSGRLDFSFLYWGSFGADDSLNWGACYHPITGGTGAFRGATGVLVFADTPVGAGVLTRYTGSVTIERGQGARARKTASASAARQGCGAR